ncbi:MAG: formylglycine-generating enzyme family protein [Polyangiales bacterium]
MDWGGWLLAAGSLAAFVALGTARRDAPRCPVGLVPIGARCCGEGQTLEMGRCVGVPKRCSEGLELRSDGCVATRGKVEVAAGESSWKPPDTTLATAGEHAKTTAFALDDHEVTWAAWDACVAAGKCARLVGGDPGQAVHDVTRDEARAYCAFASGRLPRDAEWLRAAIGEVEKRYPWGDPDAFCLRAAFGLKDGLCGWGAIGPDTAGARPWGKSPLGIHDLAGNVAEWVDDGAPEGLGAVRGGSYIESDATALRPRWRRVIAESSRLPWVGFRCAYDVTPSKP